MGEARSPPADKIKSVAVGLRVGDDPEDWKMTDILRVLF